MKRAAVAEAVDFLAMFLLGFMLGMVRVVLMTPHATRMGATFVKLPVKLAIFWLACR